jgi:hypothetical protein
MSFLTTNPSPYLLNMPELQNVITSAAGTNATANLTSSVNDILTYINTDTGNATFNSIGAYNKSYVYITNNLNLSNAELYMNDAFVMGSNTIVGWPHLSLKTNGVERAYLNERGFGINTANPTALLDVSGNARIRGTLEVAGIQYPSDPSLKRDAKPYVSNNIPNVYEFIWRATGQRDIGVMADEVAAIEPTCVKQGVAGLTVDYPKLAVLCLAEISALRTQIKELQRCVGLNTECVV